MCQGKKSLSIFQKERYRNEIRKMAEFTNRLENIKIKKYNDNKFNESIGKIKGLETSAE